MSTPRVGGAAAVTGGAEWQALQFECGKHRGFGLGFSKSIESLVCPGSLSGNSKS